MRELAVYWVVEYLEKRDMCWRAASSNPRETRREARAARDHFKHVFPESRFRVVKFVRTYQ